MFLSFQAVSVLSSTSSYLNWVFSSVGSTENVTQYTHSSISQTFWGTSTSVNSSAVLRTQAGTTTGTTTNAQNGLTWGFTGNSQTLDSTQRITTCGSSTTEPGLTISSLRTDFMQSGHGGITFFTWTYTDSGLSFTASLTTRVGATTSSSTFRTLSPIGSAETTTSSTSISTSASSTLHTTSATNSHYFTSVSYQYTTRTNATQTDVRTTFSTTVETTRWTVGGSTKAKTTWTVSTTSTSFASSLLTAIPTTATASSSRNTNTFFGFVTGLGMLATANGGPLELPGWLIGSNFTGAIAGLWNYTAATQGTAWAVLPYATTGSVTFTLTSQIVHTGSFSVTSATTYTLAGTSSFTTTVSTTVVDKFTHETNTSTVGNSNRFPPATTSFSVTSFAAFTESFTSTFTTPINTIFNGTTSTVTNSWVVPGSSSNGTRGTTFTLTTLVNGYTTATVAFAAGNRTLISTVIVTGPSLSMTTTSVTGIWWYDWSSPTVLIPSPQTSSSSGSTTNTSATSETTTHGQTGAATFDFIRNVFAQPYQVPWGVSSITSPTDTVGLPAIGTVAFWSAMPFMQAFIPWTQTTATYAGVAAPAGFGGLLGPMASGPIESFDTDLTSQGPVTTTTWGVWGFLGAPHTTTGTYSTGTSTMTRTYLDSWTAQNSFSDASSTCAATVAFPPNMNEASASISIASTYTTSTTASPGTTTVASSSTYSGLTMASAVTSTFCESTSFTDGRPNVPGIGGTPRLVSGECTIWAINAAISLFWNSSSTWSGADINLFGIVIGDNITASASTTSDLGAGAFTVYSFPGHASLITSPAIIVSTTDSSSAQAINTETYFWLLPDTSNTLTPVLPLRA